MELDEAKSSAVCSQKDGRRAASKTVGKRLSAQQHVRNTKGTQNPANVTAEAPPKKAAARLSRGQRLRSTQPSLKDVIAAARKSQRQKQPIGSTAQHTEPEDLAYADPNCYSRNQQTGEIVRVVDMTALIQPAPEPIVEWLGSPPKPKHRCRPRPSEVCEAMPAFENTTQECAKERRHYKFTQLDSHRSSQEQIAADERAAMRLAEVEEAETESAAAMRGSVTMEDPHVRPFMGSSWEEPLPNPEEEFEKQFRDSLLIPSSSRYLSAHSQVHQQPVDQRESEAVDESTDYELARTLAVIEEYTDVQALEPTFEDVSEAPVCWGESRIPESRDDEQHLAALHLAALEELGDDLHGVIQNGITDVGVEAMRLASLEEDASNPWEPKSAWGGNTLSTSRQLSTAHNNTTGRLWDTPMATSPVTNSNVDESVAAELEELSNILHMPSVSPSIHGSTHRTSTHHYTSRAPFATSDIDPSGRVGADDMWELQDFSYESLLELGSMAVKKGGVKDIACMADVVPDAAVGTTCSICLEGFAAGEQYVPLICAHAFHIDCIKRWTTENDDCPNCRAPIAAEKMPRRLRKGHSNVTESPIR